MCYSSQYFVFNGCLKEFYLVNIVKVLHVLFKDRHAGNLQYYHSYYIMILMPHIIFNLCANKK